MSGAAVGEFTRHLVGSGWAPVNRKAMDDERLSVEARGVLAWLVTRPDDHKIFVRYAQRRLGISQSRWQRIRKELESAGYLVIQKSKGEDGIFLWNYHLFDDPEAQKPHKTKVSTIGQKSIGGLSTGGLSTGGKPADNKRHTKRETSVLDKYLQDNAHADFVGSQSQSSQNPKSTSENQNQSTKEEDGKREGAEELIVRLAKTTAEPWKKIMGAHCGSFGVDALKGLQRRFTNIRKRKAARQ